MLLSLGPQLTHRVSLTRGKAVQQSMVTGEHVTTTALGVEVLKREPDKVNSGNDFPAARDICQFLPFRHSGAPATRDRLTGHHHAVQKLTRSLGS